MIRIQHCDWQGGDKRAITNMKYIMEILTSQVDDMQIKHIKPREMEKMIQSMQFPKGEIILLNQTVDSAYKVCEDLETCMGLDLITPGIVITMGPSEIFYEGMPHLQTSSGNGYLSTPDNERIVEIITKASQLL